eukprot:g5902.t1
MAGGDHGADDGHNHGHDDEVPAGKMVSNPPPRLYMPTTTTVLVMALVLAIAIPGSDKTLPDKAQSVIANAVLLSLTALVIIAVGFEVSQHHLQHMTPDQFKPVLHAINSELMSVGFLAIIFYFMIKFKLLIMASEATICESCRPCAGGKCTAEYIVSGHTNHYDAPHPKLEDGKMLRNGTLPAWTPPSRRRSARRLTAVDDLGNLNFHRHMLWRMGEQVAGDSLAHEQARRRLAGPKVYQAIGFTGSSGAKVEKGTYDENGVAEWKTVGIDKGAVNCSVTGAGSSAGTGRRSLLGRMFFEGAGVATSVEERHERAWGKKAWARWKATAGHGGSAEARAAARRLGGSANPYYTCECKGCDILLIGLFENVHMGLFLTLILYFIRAVILLRQTMAIGVKLKRWEAVVQTKGEAEIIKRYYEKKGAGDTTDMMTYLMLRMRFVNTGKGGKPLGADFSFAEYLNIKLGKTAADLVHIPPRAYIVLEGFFILFWAAMKGDSTERARVFVLYVWVLFGGVAFMMYKLLTIRDALTAPWPSAGSGGQYADASPAFLEQLAASEPTYLKDNAKAHDPQGALYWFGKTERFGKHAGAAFMLHMIRLSVIVEIIFVVLIFNAIPFVLDEDKSYIGVIIAMILPTIVVNVMAPQRMLYLHTVASSIELWKDPKAIDQTIRTVKFAKSIRTIKLLRSLQTVAQMNKADMGGDKKVDLGPETDEELERKHQMKEVFDMFDESGDGEVDMGEMSGLMSAIGMTFTDDEKTLLMKELDASGDGQISFDEFWQYMRRMAAPADPETIVQDVFSLIDKDGSGSITADEFSEQLKALPVDISEDDIEALVREVDASGDGEIDLHEFSDVLAKYK